MDSSIFLFTAFSLTWSVIFLYIFRLFKSQKALADQIVEIEKALREKKQGIEPHEANRFF